MKKVSVIIPVYNTLDYASKCIESVIDQTYKNLEIIIVNDGSTDGSAELCESFKSKDPRIVVVHKANGGLSDARNFGLKIATGEYIGFVDSDDWIENDMFEKMVNILEKNDSDIIICNFIRTSDPNYKLAKQQKEKNTIFKNNIEALRAMFIEKLFASHACNKLYKKKLFKDINFPKGKLFEDQYVTYRLLWNAKRVAFTNQQYYYYYCRDDSIITSSFTNKKLDILDAYNQIIRFFEYNERSLVKYIENEWVNIYIMCCFEAQKSNKLNTDEFDFYHRQIKKYYKRYMTNNKNKKINKCILFLLVNHKYLFSKVFNALFFIKSHLKSRSRK